MEIIGTILNYSKSVDLIFFKALNDITTQHIKGIIVIAEVITNYLICVQHIHIPMLL